MEPTVTAFVTMDGVMQSPGGADEDRGDVVEAVRALKNKPGGELQVHGSAGLVRASLGLASTGWDGQVLPTPVPVGAAGWPTSQDNWKRKP